MRRTSNDQQVLREGNTFIGVVLGYDHCAEHEWGIKDIKRAFGMPEEPNEVLYGLTARTVNRMPKEQNNFKGYHIRETKKHVTLGTTSSWVTDDEALKQPLQGERELSDDFYDKPLQAAWNEEGFCLRVPIADRAIVDELYQAMLNQDLAIWLMGRSNPFGGSGLVLCIASRVPEQHKQTMAEGDLDNIHLKAAARATGIYEKLEAADCRYYALSPRWKDDSKTEVTFWLNPAEQHKNNYGWYTVADLEAWTRGEGKIPMTDTQRKEKARR